MKFLLFGLFIMSSANAAQTGSWGITHLVSDYFSNRSACDKFKEYEYGCEHPNKKIRVNKWVSMIYQVSCGSPSCVTEELSYKFDDHTLAGLAQMISSPGFKRPKNCKDAAGKDVETMMKSCMARRLYGWPTLSRQVKSYLNLPDPQETEETSGAVTH